jgi:hypothetical protein
VRSERECKATFHLNFDSKGKQIYKTLKHLVIFNNYSILLFSLILRVEKKEANSFAHLTESVASPASLARITKGLAKRASDLRSETFGDASQREGIVEGMRSLHFR